MDNPVPHKFYYQLSDLNPKELAAFEATWHELVAERRLSVMDDLHELAEANFEVNFDGIFRLGIEDEDAEVRATSIRALWEAEDETLIAPFITALQKDPTATVRAAAASALGRYVYLGEIEEINETFLKRVEVALLAAINGTDEIEVRRRALEAIAFSSKAEINDLIKKAYAETDELWRVSAVFAMGRNSDEAWAPTVLKEMNSPSPEIRFEATRAAGELGLKHAVTDLISHTDDGDTQVREAAIWSLGQIGGPEAQEHLRALLAKTTDDAEQDFIQEAIDNADFADEIESLDFLNFDEEDLKPPTPKKRKH
jgi:HEAT repeat protein